MTIVYDVQSQILAARYTAVCRGEMPLSEMAAWLAGAFSTVGGYLKDNSVVPSGPPFARYAFLDGCAAVEAGFPVPYEVAARNGVEASVLPDGPAAITTHVGRYEDLDRAYEAIHTWLDRHGYAEAGPHWEVYFTDPNTEPDVSRWRTDVVQPYRVK